MACAQQRRITRWLRPIGLTLIAIAYAAATSLRDRARAGPLAGDPVSYLLAALLFVCAATGAALVLMGKHVFEEVEVAPRWRHDPMEYLGRRSRRPPVPELYALRVLGFGMIGRPRLTSRENGVLALLAGGASAREVASRLGVPHEAVQRDMETLRQKFDAANTADLILRAFVSGALSTAQAAEDHLSVAAGSTQAVIRGQSYHHTAGSNTLNRPGSVGGCLI